MNTRKLSLDELGRLDVESYKETEKLPVVVVLDDIRSALNVGSIFRTSDCLAIKKILLCGITAKPPHKEIFKTAIGASQTVEWEYFEDINEALSTLNNTSILAIEQTSSSISLNDISSLNLKQEIAIILGNEVKGVSDEAISKSDYCIELAQYGTKHSFNVSVCSGIVLWTLSNLLRTN